MADAEMEVRAPAPLETESLSLDELAAVANREHDGVRAAIGTAVLHAITSGEALLAARKRIPDGEWGQWLGENFRGATETANQYMRLAFYRDHVIGFTRTRQAFRSLRGLPAIDGTKRTAWRDDPEFVANARRMIESGLSQSAAARILGVSPTTVAMAVDPAYRKKRLQKSQESRARRRRERVALLRAERDKAIRSLGGGISEIYSQLRLAAQAVDRLAANGESREIRAAALNAYSKVVAAEDEIVRALGISHGDDLHRFYVLGEEERGRRRRRRRTS